MPAGSSGTFHRMVYRRNPKPEGFLSSRPFDTGCTLQPSQFGAASERTRRPPNAALKQPALLTTGLNPSRIGAACSLDKGCIPQPSRVVAIGNWKFKGALGLASGRGAAIANSLPAAPRRPLDKGCTPPHPSRVGAAPLDEACAPPNRPHKAHLPCYIASSGTHQHSVSESLHGLPFQKAGNPRSSKVHGGHNSRQHSLTESPCCIFLPAPSMTILQKAHMD